MSQILGYPVGQLVDQVLLSVPVELLNQKV